MTSRKKLLSYPYVVSTLALVVATSGGAYAAGLAKNSVKSKHIAPGAVQTSDLGADAVTGDKVKEATLGKVPSAASADTAGNAATLGGLPASGFVSGDRIMSGRALQALGVEDVVFAWPEAGWKLVGDGNGTFSGWGVKVVYTGSGGEVSVYDLSSGDGGASVATTGFPWTATAAQFMIVDPTDRTRVTYVTCAESGDAPVYSYCTGIRSR
jgi:hypothetical protein